MLGFGTTLWLRAGHASAERADAGLDAAIAAIRHVERQMSLFEPTSAVCQLNRDGVLHNPHPDLVKVLQLAQQVSRRSNGAFDLTVQPLWLAWQRAQRAGRLPTAAELDAARAMRLARAHGVTRIHPAAKTRHGAHAQWHCAGLRQRPGAGRIAGPRHRARVDNIFDPRTGYSPRELASVTVAAPTCAMADALTKVMFMAGPVRAFDVARQWQVDVLVVDKAGRWRASPGLSAGA